MQYGKLRDYDRIPWVRRLKKNTGKVGSSGLIVIGGHRGKIHDCPFASLGHQWGKRREG
jgi:hypothetical protein